MWVKRFEDFVVVYGIKATPGTVADPGAQPEAKGATHVKSLAITRRCVVPPQKPYKQ